MKRLVTLALVATAASGAAQPDSGLGLCVAPDQPIPHIYVGDPLIVEFTSASDVEAQIDIELQSDQMASPTVIALNKISLHAAGSHWQPIEDVAGQRGRYTLRARLTIDGTIIEKTAHFCRIDRPVAEDAPLVWVSMDAVSRSQLLALKAIGIRRLRFPAVMADLDARVAEAAGMGFKVALNIEGPDFAGAEDLAQQFAGRIVRWEIDPGGAPASFGAAAKALRGGGVRAPLALAADDAEALSTVLEAGMGPYVDAVEFQCDETGPFPLKEIRGAAERAGYERMEIDVSFRGGVKEGPGAGAILSRQVLLAVAADAQATLDAAAVYGEDFGPGYVYLSALAHRLGSAAYIGQLPAPGDVQAYVYRQGGQWTVAVWKNNAAPGAEEPVSFPVEGASGLALFDGCNNPLAAPEPKDGAVTLAVGASPLFLCGTGGPILAQAARNAIREKAEAFVGNAEFKKHLPEEIIELVEIFLSSNETPYNRIDFFNLLKTFPVVEELWHTGGLSRSVAAPAQACLSRLGRSLCVMEQEKGEPFVEPLRNTLDTCGQFQSLYITGSAGTAASRERPDWLSDEVSRLMAEAERLSKAGRPIEAVAVAALAEWRARSLEIAAKAKPLSEPEPPPEAVAAPAESAPAPEPASNAAPPDAAPAAPAAPQVETTIHLVKPGDNPSLIAEQYGMKLDALFEANGWTKTPVLHVGDKVTVRKKHQ